MIKRIIHFIFIIISLQVNGQQQAVVIEGATIHIGNGKVFEKGVIGFDSGRIVFVDSLNRNSYKNARVINASGKHVYPGLILLNTYLGLNEIDAVRSTRDYDETGDLNPNVRSLIAYNTDSKVVPTATFNGVSYMQIVPQGGIVSGTSCIVKTQAMNWEDALVKEDGIHVNWPEAWKHANNEQQQKIIEQKEKIEQLFTDASNYKNHGSGNPANLKLEAMMSLFNGERRLFIHAGSASSINEVLQFAKKYPSIKTILVSNSNAALMMNEIKQSGVPVIINLVHSLPLYNHSDVDQPYKTAAQLTAFGIKTALGFSGSWESRNVMFNAGTCAAYGIGKEEALQLITGNAALICGIENETGTLEKGKKATIIISNGDVLDMKESRLELMFIDGEDINLSNAQTDLYKKYSNRFGLEVK